MHRKSGKPRKLFCGTPNDYIASMSRFEATQDIRYVDMDYRECGIYPTYNSIGDLPYLGSENKARSAAGTRGTLILPVDNSEFNLSYIELYNGTTDIVIEAECNLHGFVIQFGGFNDKDVLMGGRTIYNGDNPKTLALLKACEKEVCRGATVLKDWLKRSWYVGPEALEFLKSGGRISTGPGDIESPMEDLKLPPDLK